MEGLATVKAAFKGNDVELARLTTDRDMPAGAKGHLVREGLEVRRWPAVYLTPAVTSFVALWRLHRAGNPLRTDGVLTWPYPMIQAIQRLDAEAAHG